MGEKASSFPSDWGGQFGSVFVTDISGSYCEVPTARAFF